MSNPLIRKMVQQCRDRYPEVPFDIIEAIWLAGYSTGRKGKLKRPQRYNASDFAKGFIDKGLDVIENTVDASETKMNDALVLPVINMIRTTFDIPQK